MLTSLVKELGNYSFRIIKSNNWAVITIFVLFLNLNPIIHFAQSPAIKIFTTENSLPSNTIYEIRQDKKGYLWLATENGISRYNGGEFFNSFTYLDKKLNRDISNIFEGPNGKMWFVNMDCLLMYHQNDTIFPYPYNKILKSHLKSVSYTFKNSQFIDENGTLFISCGSTGILQIDSSTNTS